MKNREQGGLGDMGIVPSKTESVPGGEIRDGGKHDVEPDQVADFFCTQGDMLIERAEALPKTEREGIILMADALSGAALVSAKATSPYAKRQARERNHRYVKALALVLALEAHALGAEGVMVNEEFDVTGKIDETVSDLLGELGELMNSLDLSTDVLSLERANRADPDWKMYGGLESNRESAKTMHLVDVILETEQKRGGLTVSETTEAKERFRALAEYYQEKSRKNEATPFEQAQYVAQDLTGQHGE